MNNSSTQVELGQAFKCKCGKEHKFTGYVAAHWYEELILTCECGLKYSVLRGTVTPEQSYDGEG